MQIKSTTFAAAGIISKSWMRGDYDPEKLLKEYQQEIEQLLEAVIAENPDLDLLLAQLLEDMPGDARIALVRKVQEMVNEREAEKSAVLQRYLEQLQEQRERRREEFKRQGWLAHFMSRETLRKLREVFFARPLVQEQVRDIGQDLAAKGILQNIQIGQVQDLGTMAHNAAQTAPGFDKGRDGRGV